MTSDKPDRREDEVKGGEPALRAIDPEAAAHPADGRLEGAFDGLVERSRPDGPAMPLWEVRYVDETRLFLLVSVADLVLTVLLLRAGAIREANPLARWVIASCGTRGLIAFKFALVAVVCVAAQAIGRADEGRGLWVMRLATAVTGGVACYGAWLFFGRV